MIGTRFGNSCYMKLVSLVSSYFCSASASRHSLWMYFESKTRAWCPPLNHNTLIQLIRLQISGVWKEKHWKARVLRKERDQSFCRHVKMLWISRTQAFLKKPSALQSACKTALCTFHIPFSAIYTAIAPDRNNVPLISHSGSSLAPNFVRPRKFKLQNLRNEENNATISNINSL